MMTADDFERWVAAIAETQKKAVFGYWDTPKSDLACECGADAVKATFHSDYCPKYE